MNAWMNSSGHRANILSKNVEYIGVGVVYSNGIYYWTQLFASSDSISDAYLPDKNNETPDETTNKAEITITTTTTVTTPTTQLTSTSQTTVTNETISKSTTETTVTNTPTFTLPDLSDYFNPDNENIIISPEHFDIYDFLLNNEICIDKCCRNAKDNFTEFYTNLKDNT